MNSCKHDILTLVKARGNKLRCRHCHLTISKEELGSGFCPECLEVRKIKHRDFDNIVENEEETTRYCCEKCGMVIDI